MIVLALATCLAAGGGRETDLPRSLGDDERSYLLPTPDPAAKADLPFWGGLHVGVADPYDAQDAVFIFGINARLHFLSWLGAEATLDFQTRQSYEHSQLHVTVVPVEFAALFYIPVEPVRPYGIAGVGIAVTDASYSGAFSRSSSTDLQGLFFLGFGLEMELSSEVHFDVNLRFVFSGDPPHFQGNSVDWLQFTVGILVKLSK
jgi:opacity protein-like surface antigen